MYSFTNDYSEGAHPRILEAVLNANLEQNTGYGLDTHCGRAADLIRRECQDADAAVHFFVGGTQTNMTLIAHGLRPHQAVISASTGHINVHETGAVEATGHKVFSIPKGDGKLTPEDVLYALSCHQDEHFVQPRMVYISNTTELGTQYTKEELEGLSRICRLKGLYLFLDGARLGSALTSPVNDLTIADIAALTDAFYIGGTKNGALFGEALIITKPALNEDFRFAIKQRGGMLAKGFLLGIQFETLFTDGLFYELAEHANRMAARLRKAFEDQGFAFLAPSFSNQLFPVVTDAQADKLAEKYSFNTEKNLGNGTRAIRFVTSWATKETAVKELIEDLKQL